MKTLDTECRISNQTERARPKIIAIRTIHNKFFNWICKKRERKKNSPRAIRAIITESTLPTDLPNTFFDLVQSLI